MRYLILIVVAFSGISGLATEGKTVTIDDSYVKPDMKYKIIRLQSLDFKTVAIVCRPWLSKGGKLTNEKRINAILVYDTLPVINKIEKFVAGNDRQAVNIRIDFDSFGGGPVNNSRLGVYPQTRQRRYSRPQSIVYKNGKRVTQRYRKKPTNYVIKADLSRSSMSSLNSSFITTKSGSPATLWSGRTMVDPSWLRFSRVRPEIIVIGSDGKYATIDGVREDTKWTDVGTSLQVLPRDLGNGMIEVEIYPSISYLTGRKKHQTVKVDALTTKVIVRDGQRIPVGGVIAAKRQRYLNLFGPTFFSSKEVSNAMNSYLKATIIKPGQSLRQHRSWIPQ